MPGVEQLLEVVADGRLLEVEHRLEVADAHGLAARPQQPVEDPHAMAVGERLEHALELARPRRRRAPIRRAEGSTARAGVRVTETRISKKLDMSTEVALPSHASTIFDESMRSYDMPESPPLPVAVIGAGPVGLAAAAHLVARGIEPLVFEAGEAVGAERPRLGARARLLALGSSTSTRSPPSCWRGRGLGRTARRGRTRPAARSSSATSSRSPRCPRSRGRIR